ncbi:bifunctional [glutamine synthetase] adenylyltransferase/[glutamine synthetase]-adenylyl-L-tyrosine phosphorylase [Methylocystis sp. MJC1]|uniref:bifunctional [glutamine synthetase] adenylyltransferase/[glutamine synthetase]-adenylyl-L-tyrosine phosphorylase n=1 Tax=Methylocystis sp. MJC1 TaxID=2654282 RepID=UPI0013ECF594|nr:bifunctional [glutamine synthetase] adenylyltransferase/[glutamine synthetase]-adenylyl-L-tyrosine phosphorylase [Methylocystis sp. MJC1]KAF2990391.1 Glutamate-ammonia-ligase adenylyltransferase [Methylocystis sp. MJC1]MBU6528185.1 bifunctional [glutamine synthetase] adenylyltransferase/[glutamine synthetase]-adenylyl-L-tyrosine phosphorylase [Methylocystis sp. MJC1]UZX11096.1 bifunctional [glutamine synthetase] adenylyltransferase/[glutamine synthetase]-adenylyl-L-tyrosine phosphorylase [Met
MTLDADALLSRAKIIISGAEPEKAQKALDRVLEKDKGALASFLAAQPKARDLLLGVLGSSSYLTDLAARDPARLAAALAADPQTRIGALIDDTKALETDDEAEIMRRLRLIKQEAALVIALADLSKAWDTLQATEALTRIADAMLSAAIRFTLRQAQRAGKLELADQRDPERASGWIFLGMGKGGAYELNYSSDIDLIVFFDRSRARLTDPSEDVDLFVKLTKRIVKIMSERTSDGYVFRTDLRLRPDPGATPIAIPLEAALSYYESMGQNWERAAYIKARPVAGDIYAGEQFLQELSPFVWRKYFDFAAIADVHSIKRQIHAHKGHGKIAVIGHNIKLGRGGIREIEFFTQTQQLITGGRDKRLRGRATLPMLDQLVESGWVEAQARDDLREAYLFLRDVEHRIQMVADEQKHTLPDTRDGVENIARMMGFAGYDDFAEALMKRLDIVQGHYARLFETAPELSSAGGNLVFTGDEDDPETIETLAGMGYKDPKMVTATIRGWHFGRYAATRSTVARERLTELTPKLLEALAATDNADQAFLAFDKLIQKLPAGVQLFSLLVSQPRLLTLLAAITGAAPKLSATISKRPRVLDALMEPAFFHTLPSDADLRERLAAQFAEARSYEDALDRARIFGQEQKFLIGVRVLTGSISVADVGAAYTRLAETLIACLFEEICKEFEKAHGRIEKGAAAVVAMGKLGGREMTAASDLDLMLLYDADPHAESVGGERSLSTAQYYARLTQRLITAISAPTAEGTLYETDFRLRPSGNMGPIAVSLKSFEAYQAEEAWTWEHMALTRARVVAGPAEFAARVEAAIRAALVRPRDPHKLKIDVLAMRKRIEQAKGSNNPWEVKQAPGGLIDIEFIAQYLMLLHGAAHPEVFSTTTPVALRMLRDASLLDAGAAETLHAASSLYQGLTQVLRLAVDGPFRPTDAPRGLTELLLRVGDSPDLSHLEALLADSQKRTREIFTFVIGPFSGPITGSGELSEAPPPA